jgi:hydrogenase 3 maturation protease
MSAPPAEPGLLPSLRSLLRGRVVVMGIGNPLRGDDAVGSVIARLLHASIQATSSPALPATATVLDAEEIPECWLGPAVAARPDTVLLVDAVELGALPGAVALLSAGELSGRALFTHRTPLRPLTEYLESETHARVALLGVQPGPLRWGEELSPPVAATAADLALLLTDVLAGPRTAAPSLPDVAAGARAAPSAPEAFAC